MLTGGAAIAGNYYFKHLVRGLSNEGKQELPLRQLCNVKKRGSLTSVNIVSQDSQQS